MKKETGRKKLARLFPSLAIVCGVFLLLAGGAKEDIPFFTLLPIVFWPLLGMLLFGWLSVFFHENGS